ncbi:DUF5682 family protein [Streptomyces abikoensis]|uniref:DUF5682 family protein n=1 Tax=Streptomyces abikoensis TaxID=97398 RepID=UPI00340D8BF7
MTGAAAAPEPVLLGVRHHGPGSARAVRAALDRCRPTAVLIEGPPEADALIPLAADQDMRPPVALLAHVTGEPGRAAFWPFAEFSPEWVALRWALAHGVPVRFIDLPAAHTLALGAGGDSGRGPEGGPGAETEPGAGPVRAPGTETEPGVGAEPGRGPEGGAGAGVGPGQRTGLGVGAKPGAKTGSGRGSGSGPGAGVDACERTTPGPGAETGPGAEPEGAPGPAGVAHPRADPLAVLAGAAGYDDAEVWWEDVVEHRRGEGDALAPFEAVAEAMGELRAALGQERDTDAIREAHMRLKLREARREFGGVVAVVCGAWHVPALAERRTVTVDRQALKGLPKAKVEIGWVPWTHRRLSRHSGYGAGIASPGWYGHLFRSPDRPVERWMTDVARLLRAEGHPVSSAHVIEAVRLAETLAAMRGRPLAGLAETVDAIRAVMCDGSDVPLALVRDRLVVGDVLGEVPDAAPASPLQRDLDRQRRTLRLKPEAAPRDCEFDLREDTDAARSRLLHRLRLLGVDWGDPLPSRGGLGTFRESWRLCWEPELSVRIAEAGVWGTTVEGAATAKAESLAREATTLAGITGLAERCLLAGLPDALPVVMRALADRAALDSDAGHLAQALPALVRSVRYGDVRRTDTAALAEVAAGLAERVFVGLPAACAGLDTDAAAEMRGHVDAVHRSVALLAGTADEPAAVTSPATTPGLRGRWAAVLKVLAERDALPGGIRGRATRLLLDDGRLPHERAARLMGLVLSAGTPPAEAAAWIEGFLGTGGSGGMLLVHDERLLALVDGWLTAVPPDAFTGVLPLLRRTFSAFEPGVRRTLGDRVRRHGTAGPGPDPSPHGAPAGFGPALDPRRAAAVLPTMRLLLGTGPEAVPTEAGPTGTGGVSV